LQIFCFHGIGLDSERAYRYLGESGEMKIRNPVAFVDGDGTVPLISLSYLCSSGWRGPRLNPAGVQVRTREYAHRTAGPLAGRSNANASDHVDILGNSEMIGDILKVVSGEGAEIADRIESAIGLISRRVDANLRRAAAGE